MCPKAPDGIDQRRDAAAVRRNGLDDRRPPFAGPIGLQRQVGFDRRHQPVGSLTVGLVHHEHVGNLHDAGLERLDLVAGARHECHDRDVRRADDVHFVLTDADGLDDDDVFAGRVEHERNVAGRARQAAEMPTGGHAADIHAGVGGVSRHPHAIAKDGATRERAGRIDSNDANSQTSPPDFRRQRIDQRTLARARRTGYADQIRAASTRINLPDQRGGCWCLVLDHRDGACDRPPVAGQNRVDERQIRRQAAAERSRAAESRSCPRRSS